MRKRVLLFLTVIIGFCASYASCADMPVPSIKDRWAANASFAYVMPEDAEYKESNNLLGSVGLSYGVTENVATELEVGYFRLRSKNDTKTRVVSVLGNIELRAKNFGKLTPYILGGIGVAFFEYGDLHPTEQKDKNFSHAWKAGAGLEYRFNDNWAGNFEAGHFYADTGGKTHLDVYNWQLNLGLKYYF